MHGRRAGYGVRLDSARRLLDASNAVVVQEAVWPAGRVRLSGYLGLADLPTEIPGRVRCLVVRDHEVLITWDTFGVADCLPGGGAHPGESVVQTAVREVWEETGWHIEPQSIAALGWIHLECLYEFNPDGRYPYPDSFMTVVRARPIDQPAAPDAWSDTDGFIAKSVFMPRHELPEEVQTNTLARLFLDEAFKGS